MALGKQQESLCTTLIGRLDEALAGERTAILQRLQECHEKIMEMMEPELLKISTSGVDTENTLAGVFQSKSVEEGRIVECLEEPLRQASAPNFSPRPRSRNLTQEDIKIIDDALSMRPMKMMAFQFKEVWETHGMLRATVDSPWFEAFFVMIIIANTFSSALYAQYRGFDFGYAVTYPDIKGTAESTWPGASDVFRVSETTFAIIYTIEIAFKLAAYQCLFWRDRWNIFDFTIVALWYLVEVSNVSFGNPTILRLCRLARLMRLVRHIGWFEAFDSLHMLITAIHSSFSILFWATMLIFIMLVIASLFIYGLLSPYFDDIVESANIGVVWSKDDLAQRRELFEYFGTFTRTFISMFDMTFGNHANACRIIIEYVGEGYAIFLLLYKAVVSLSVMKVITGVFLHETFTVCQEDDDLMVVQNRRAAREHMKKMNKLFETVDEDGDGCLSWEEFEETLASEWVRTWMALMELDATNVRRLWRLIDDGDGKVTAEELIEGVRKLKGLAKSVDLNHLSLEINLLKDEVMQMLIKMAATQQHLSTHSETITRIHAKMCAEDDAAVKLAQQPAERIMCAEDDATVKLAQQPAANPPYPPGRMSTII